MSMTAAAQSQAGRDPALPQNLISPALHFAFDHVLHEPVPQRMIIAATLGRTVEPETQAPPAGQIDRALLIAARAGYQTGLNPFGEPRDCPYLDADDVVHRAWQRGFRAGQGMLQAAGG